MENNETKNESLHTPGPCEEDGRSNCLATIANAETGEIVCDVNLIHKSGSGESNTKLIAASPDLLDALKSCVELLEQLPTLNGLPGLAVLENAKEVIKKAI